MVYPHPIPRPYSTRRAAQASGLSPKQVRGYVYAHVITPDRGPRGAFRFSFQDVAILRASRLMQDQGVPARRVRQSLAKARARQQAREAPWSDEAKQGGNSGLSSLSFEPAFGHVTARDQNGVWLVATGQGILDLDLTASGTPIREPDMPSPVAPRAVQLSLISGGQESHEGDPEVWFDRGVDLEVEDPLGARAAYREALANDPGHVGARANLGRLLHQQGELGAAEEHYRQALEQGLGDGTAAYNLGVVLEDRGRLDEAVEAYLLALQANAGFSEAHFNLARIREAQGDRARALGHLVEYRRLQSFFQAADD